MENTLTMVPLSDAVASKVPVSLTAIQDRGDRCASTTLIASNLRVSKRRTSPEVGGICVLPGGA